MNEQSLVRATMVIPAPMMSEIDREKRVLEAKISAWANGCVIEKEIRIHNPVFDKRAEKTTTKLVIRPATTDSEIEYLKSKLLAHTKREGGEK